MSTVTAAKPDAETRATTAVARRPRGSVSRDHVLKAALDLVDREGLDSLSMRRLATELDVETMSLYKRVASKDDLLAGIAELVWGEVADAVAPHKDWSRWLRAFAHAIRAAVHSHPNALPALVGIDVFPVALLEVIDAQLGRTTDSGPSYDDAVSAVSAVTSYALGTALTETCLHCANPSGAKVQAMSEQQRLRRIVRALPADAPDRLLDTAMAVCGCDTERVFTRGLDLIIRGCTT
jgi:TetR/AcrR family tetracycline transcriptional repressor